MIELSLKLGGQLATVPVETLIIAGWTGRDRAAVDAHIDELAELGVPRPSSVPVFYRASCTRLVTAEAIESTESSSGEVEPVLLHHDDRLWVGVGSDHTDRELERHSVAASKQLCDKPVGSEFWLYEDVVDHWDELVLRSWIDGDVKYQEGQVASLLSPDELLALARPTPGNGTLMFCGTMPAIGGIRSSSEFRYQLDDPLRGRAIEGGYSIRDLPLVS